MDSWPLLYLHISRFEPLQQGGQSWPLGVAQGPLLDTMSVCAKLPAQASQLCSKAWADKPLLCSDAGYWIKSGLMHCCAPVWSQCRRKLKVRLKIRWWIKTLFRLLRSQEIPVSVWSKRKKASGDGFSPCYGWCCITPGVQGQSCQPMLHVMKWLVTVKLQVAPALLSQRPVFRHFFK